MYRGIGLPNIGLFSIVLGTLLSVVGRAEDWPAFRGPTAQGISKEKNLPQRWDAGTSVLWKVPVEGEGWSSPVLVNGKIYLTAAVAQGDGDKPDRSLRLMCFDAKTGKRDWDQQVFVQEGASAPNIHSKNSHASPTPIVDGDRIYVHFGHQGTACLDLQGKSIWTNREIKYAPVHGAGCSPVLYEGKLIFSCDGAQEPFVVALSTKDGKEVWRYHRVGEAPKHFAFCTPLIIEVNGKKQIFSAGADQANSLDPDTGKAIWTVRYTGYSLVCRPVFGHGMVFFSSCYDNPVVFAVKADGQGDVTDTHVAWQLDKGAPNSPSLLLVDDELYMVSDGGVATCVDAITGKTHWQRRLGGNFTSSPILADGKIYFQDEEGKGTTIAPGKTFKELGKSDLGERTLASYAVGDGAIFARTAKHLWRIQK